MEKIILIGFMLFLTACGSAPIRINTDVKETYVPILYSPAPPVIKRPSLPIHEMTSEQEKEDGIVVKFYKATVKSLIGYSEELESALDEYNKINKAYKAQEDKIKTKIGDKAKDLPKE